MTAREEMARFGFDRNQKPHQIFEKLSKLRNTPSPSRKIEKEIESIEHKIEQSMADAEGAYEMKMAISHLEFWQNWLEQRTFR